jgi:hypothetical protein
MGITGYHTGFIVENLGKRPLGLDVHLDVGEMIVSG